MDPEPPSSLFSSLINDFDLLTVTPMLVIVAVLLLLSGLISGSEVSFFSLSSSTKEELRNSKNTTDQKIMALLERPRELLATILVSNNLLNVGIVILSTFVLQQIFNFAANPLAAFVIEIVLVTMLILLFGEIMPKVYATASPLPLARFMATPINALKKGYKFFGLIQLLKATSSLFDKPSKSDSISVNDLEHALELTDDEGQDSDEQKILEGIVRFGSTSVRQIMTPRTDVIAFDVNDKFDYVIAKVIEHGFSRIPVYEESLDKIMGVVYIKDFLPFMDSKANFSWKDLMRDPFFVPETKKIDDLLTEFQEKKIHLAVVVDEFGGTSGVITLEDVIEEIVGEISDEFDNDDINFKIIDEHNISFEGRTSLNDFYKVLNIDGDDFEEVKGDSDTLAGFLLEISGKFPEKFETITFGEYQFKIEKIENRRIHRIKATLPKVADS